MAAGNRASDENAQGASYQLGELDLGIPAKRPAETGTVPASGITPAPHGAQAAQAQRAATAGQAAINPALAAKLAAMTPEQRAQYVAQYQAMRARALAQQQAQLQAQQRASHVGLQASQNQTRSVSQVELTPVQARQGSQAGLAPAQAQPLAATPANTQTSAQPEKGLGRPHAFDDDDGSAGPALELDIDTDALRKPARVSKAGPNAAAKGSASAQAGGQPAATRAAEKHAVPALAPNLDAFGTDKDLGDGFGETEDGPALELEHVDRKSERVSTKGPDPKAEAAKEEQIVRDMAGFGYSPSGLTDTVKYAIHVTRRLMVLKREREKAAQDAAGLEADYHTALMEMGQALMAMATDPKMQPLRSRVAAVHDANAKVTNADRTMSKTKEENLLKVQALEREAAEMRAALEPYTEAERNAEEAYKKAQADVERAEAQVKRVEIELRSATEAKADTAALDEIKARLEAKKAQVTSASALAQQAQQLLGQARRDLALRRGSLDALEDKKKALIEEQKKREAEVEASAKEAEGTYAAALRALALSCIEQKLAEELVPDRYEWVKEVGSATSDAKRVVNRYDRALTMYEKNEVIKGYAIMGGLALFFLGSFIFFLVR